MQRPRSRGLEVPAPNVNVPCLSELTPLAFVLNRSTGFALRPQGMRTFSPHSHGKISFSSCFHCIAREMCGELKRVKTVGDVH